MNNALHFSPSTPFTIGVEMELQLVDPKTWDLKPVANEIIDLIGKNDPHLKHELFESMIEINTDVCRNAHEIEANIHDKLRVLHQHCEKIGVQLASTGTHPFSRYIDGKVVAAERYQYLIDRNRLLAQRLIIFGLHVHLGMRDGEHCIAMTNLFLNHLYLLLALSASSPFWQGQDTGLASGRSTIFEALPTAGHPNPVRNWKEFCELYDRLCRCEGIHSLKDIWWDLRPSPHYGTLEIRVCDALATVRETVALVALIHALAIACDRQLDKNNLPEPPPLWVIRENKWRASRYGLEAKMIVDKDGHTSKVPEQLERLLGSLAPIASDLHYREYFDVLKQLIASGGNYNRQRLVYARTQSFPQVVEANCREFETDTIRI